MVKLFCIALFYIVLAFAELQYTSDDAVAQSSQTTDTSDSYSPGESSSGYIRQCADTNSIPNGGRPYFLRGTAQFPFIEYGDFDLTLVGNPWCVTYAADIVAAYAAYKAVQNSYGAAAAAVTTLMTSSSIRYAFASMIFPNTRICGNDWLIFGDNYQFGAYSNKAKEAAVFNADGTVTVKSADIESYKSRVEKWVIAGEKEYKPQENFNKPFSTIMNEFRYQGKEFTDNASGCKDPITDKPQTYYMKGYEAANYACERYIYRGGNPLSIDKYRTAYNCCKEKAKGNICIEYKDEHIFCKVEDSGMDNATSGKCQIKGVYFSPYYSFNLSNRVCAKTRSLCPFDFNVAGGTEECVKDGIMTKEEYIKGKQELKKLNEIKQNKFVCKNACQHLSHCTLEPPSPYQYETHLEGKMPYIDVSCFDFKGDSQNSMLYYDKVIGDSWSDNYWGNAASAYSISKGAAFGAARNPSAIKGAFQGVKGALKGAAKSFDLTGDDAALLILSKVDQEIVKMATQYKGFSAPITQCIFETVKNLTYNRAGHARCYDALEKPMAYEVCMSQNYQYKRHQDLVDDGFLQKIQNSAKTMIIAVLVLSITFAGLKSIMSSGDIPEGKVVIFTVLKIAVIMYFVVGTAWKDVFLDLVMNTSSEIGDIVMNVAEPRDSEGNLIEEKSDGCIFPKYIGNDRELEKSDGMRQKSYPDGMTYLKLFDSIDCKLSQYLGYGPTISIPNMLLLAASSLMPFSYYSVLILAASLTLIVNLVAIALISAHIFIMSGIMLSMLVLISPIIFPMMLFAKTQGIFNKWLDNVIDYSLRPFLLFLFAGIFFVVFDYSAVGSARFKSNETTGLKVINCDKYCGKADGSIMKINLDGTTDSAELRKICNSAGGILKDPKKDSLLCTINFNQLGTWPGFMIFGAAFKMLELLATGAIFIILKNCFIIFIFGKFISQIPAITGDLIGGGPATPKDFNPEELQKGLTGIMKGFHDRGASYMSGKIKQLKDAKAKSDAEEKAKNAEEDDDPPDDAPDEKPDRDHSDQEGEGEKDKQNNSENEKDFSESNNK